MWAPGPDNRKQESRGQRTGEQIWMVKGVTVTLCDVFSHDCPWGSKLSCEQLVWEDERGSRWKGSGSGRSQNEWCPGLQPQRWMVAEGHFASTSLKRQWRLCQGLGTTDRRGRRGAWYCSREAQKNYPIGGGEDIKWATWELTPSQKIGRTCRCFGRDDLTAVSRSACYTPPHRSHTSEMSYGGFTLTF